jgi:hypothetical protein
VLAGFAAGFGAVPASADGERTDIDPWRGGQDVFRTIQGWNFPANAMISLWVTDPAGTPWWQIDAQGLMTGSDGTIWFQVKPSGFASGILQNGVWQLKVCAGPCQVLTMFIGGDALMVTTGLPARICTPYITPWRDFPTFGPPGNAIDPRTGMTFNDIVAYCGPYATPWIGVNQFLVPIDWAPGMVMRNPWPYQTAFPWPAYWYGNTLYNNYGQMPNGCVYGYSC